MLSSLRRVRNDLSMSLTLFDASGIIGKCAILLLLVIGLGVGLLALPGGTTEEASVAKLKITPNLIKENQELSSGDKGALNEATLAAAIKLLRSEDFAKKAIVKFGLYGKKKNSDGAVADETTTDAVESKISTDAEVVDSGHIQKYLDSLLIVPASSNPQMLDIRFEYVDPAVSPMVINYLTSEYIDQVSLLKKKKPKSGLDALKSQVKLLEQELAISKQRLAGKLKEQERLVLRLGQQSNFEKQNLLLIGQLASAVEKRKIEEEAFDALRLAFQTGVGPNKISSLSLPPDVERLFVERAALREKLTQMLASYFPSHPRITKINSELQKSESELKAGAQRSLKIAEEKVEAARTAEELLFRKVKVSQRQSDESVADEITDEIDSLNEAVNLKTARLAEAKQKYQKELKQRQAEALLIPQVTLISSAVAREANEPNSGFSGSLLFKLVLAAFVVVGGLLWFKTRMQRDAQVSSMNNDLDGLGQFNGSMGGGNATAGQAGQFVSSEGLHSGVDSSRLAFAIEQNTGSSRGVRRNIRRPTYFSDNSPPVHVTQTQFAEPQVAPTNFQSSIVSLDNYLAELSKTQSLQIVAVASSSSPQVSQMMSIEASRNLAKNSRCLLIDLEESQTLQHNIGPSRSGPGFAEICAGRAGFGDVLQGDQFSSAHFMSAGNFDRISADHLSLKMSEVVGVLSETYNHVFVHLGLLTENYAKLMILKLVSQIAIASPPDENSMEQAKFAADRIMQSGIMNVCVVSMSQDRSNQYGSVAA